MKSTPTAAAPPDALGPAPGAFQHFRVPAELAKTALKLPQVQSGVTASTKAAAMHWGLH